MPNLVIKIAIPFHLLGIDPNVSEEQAIHQFSQMPGLPSMFEPMKELGATVTARVEQE